MTETATLSRKFQITVPKTTRAAHVWQAGQEFVFMPKGIGVLLVPVPTLEDLRGMARGADGSRSAD
jgi:bifunctional DNA-binding transcriptional regulator/antitoxin component of YhaV-PrlF toxin-antitoxin module